MQVVTGPRQVGKTTLVRQVVEASHIAARFASADEPTLRGRDWIEQQWEAARLEARDAGKRGAALVLDEIQKIPSWSEFSAALGETGWLIQRCISLPTRSEGATTSKRIAEFQQGLGDEDD